MKSRAQLAAERFAAESGPPSSPRRLNFYGHFRRKEHSKRHRVNVAHEQALVEDALRARKEAA